MKKIVIIPEFASSHLLKHWIPNIIETISPDIILINSGIFPTGPENKGHIDDEFRKKWCYENTSAGFDYDETLNICVEWNTKKFNGEHNTYIECKVIDYTSKDVNECFKQAISTSLDAVCSVGDLVFVLEPDLFLRENQSESILQECSRLEIGEGLQIVWKDFIQSQFYTEFINEVSPKWRRFCYRFDNMTNYLDAMGSGFMSQNYPKLTRCDSFIGFHYCWFVSDKWKELRYELIWRKDPQYWQDFERGLNEIENWSTEYVDDQNCEQPDYERGEILEMPDKILVRPSRQDEGRYAKFIDIEHPKAIYNHENFVK